MIIRTAEEKDIDFLVEAIIEAEKSNTSVLSYSTIFSIAEDEVREKLKEMLSEDIPGQELCISGFLIAEIDNKPVGTCCSWIEGENGNISKIIKANLLLWFLGNEKCETAAKNFPFLSDLNFDKEINTLQIESVYTKKEFRGRGITGKIIAEHIIRNKERFPELKKVQLVVAQTNESATRAYQKMGFRIISTKHSEHKDALKILPADTRIMMELQVD
jgi:ribosomal protein S18 acetylase RimI-like enzyme